jgi:hypothetical protein
VGHSVSREPVDLSLVSRTISQFVRRSFLTVPMMQAETAPRWPGIPELFFIIIGCET